jgi:hypothetical protein
VKREGEVVIEREGRNYTTLIACCLWVAVAGTMVGGLIGAFVLWIRGQM